MGDLVLSIIESYFGIGVLLSVLITILINTSKISEPFTIFDSLAFVIAWPFVIGKIISDYINSDDK
jgi:hypothetical protein